MLQPEHPASGGERRIGNTSASSIRSFSQDAIPSPTAAAIAQEREANLRTPRPHTASATGDSAADRTVKRNSGMLPPTDSATDGLNGLQWQQRREASDQTLDGQVRATSPERYYPSDSLGRISVASSAFTSGAASEFGHGPRSASEVGTDWNGVSSSASGSAARKTRKIAPPELLVVVRPPPSKQTNPLNLQIQLLTPQAGGGAQQASAGRISGESSRDELNPAQSAYASPAAIAVAGNANSNGSSNLAAHLVNPQPLRRSNSVASSRSAMSESSSVAYSIASASSTSRRVTPLYNLCFHSIVATTVTDAGTDQKVAKFNKRGVEIDGFGVLVPHELFLGVNDLASIEKRRRSTAAMSVYSGNGGSLSPSANGDDTAEARSGLALAASDSNGSGSGIQLQGQGSEPPTSFDAMSPQARDAPNDIVGGLGGKLMRGIKRLSLNPSTITTPMGKQVPGTPASVRSSATFESSQSTGILGRIKGAAVKVRDADRLDDANSERQNEPESLYDSSSDIPQLIVGAGIRSDGSRRSQGYFWTVGRWSRRSGEDSNATEDLIPGRSEAGSNPILNSVWKRFNVVNRMGGSELHPPARQITVRFEWTRTETRKRSVAGRSGSMNAAGAGLHARGATDMTGRSSLRGSIDGRGTAVSASFEIDPARRDSGDALRPPITGKSTSRPSSIYASINSAGAHSPARASMDRGSALSTEDDSDPEDSETRWACHLVLGPSTRIPIGSLAPTPHHPKLVAQLTVPYPLPDLSQSGLGADGAGLTREELKDIISVTALFVIIREAFGGLAKRRKGDSALKFGAAVAQRT